MYCQWKFSAIQDDSSKLYYTRVHLGFHQGGEGGKHNNCRVKGIVMLSTALYGICFISKGYTQMTTKSVMKEHACYDKWCQQASWWLNSNSSQSRIHYSDCTTNSISSLWSPKVLLFLMIKFGIKPINGMGNINAWSWLSHQSSWSLRMIHWHVFSLYQEPGIGGVISISPCEGTKLKRIKFYRLKISKIANIDTLFY